MFKIWKFVLFFVLCLVFALLFNLPIQQVLPHLKLPPRIQLVGIQGTVFRGTAQEIVIDQFPLQSVGYRFQPSCILLLKACYQINYEQGTLEAAYNVFDDSTEFSGMRIEYPLAELMKYVPNVPVNPVGRVELVIDELSMVQGKPTALNGKLIGRDLGVDNDGSKISIGDFQVDFTGNQKKYEFKLSDLDARLDVAGKGEIGADGQYNFDIKLNVEDGLDPKVKNVLDVFAAKADYNKYRIEQKGRLPSNLTRQLFK